MKKQIIIIGGGIVGSTAAYYLSTSKDTSVTLIDKGIGTATRAAAGIISPWLSQRRNQNWYQLTAQGAAFYQQLMEDLTEAGVKQLPYKQTGTLVFKQKPELLEKLYRLAVQRRTEAPMLGELSILDAKGIRSHISDWQGTDGAVLTSGGGRVDGGALLDILQELFVQNGGRMIKGEAHLLPNNIVAVGPESLTYDHVLLTGGAWLPELLAPLSYQVDIRPQKGQLLEVKTDDNTNHWPGCMLQGEIDILPFEQGRLVIGATHEDKMGFDLEIDTKHIQHMKTTAEKMLPRIAQYPISAIRVGTRAYTSDYLPFYGPLADKSSIWVASGLGSSGLTSGPFIGWQIAQELQGKSTGFNRRPYSPNSYIIKK
ncbi:NAD(P)/FAD-dependent oxidoreductase [Streptococcus ovis]|uniref:NAD(P)/FAD-dependent oxidoreductase n=1 Tax=Streptococcus ovis TaxID=82806 RepID=UPI00036F8685|nr:FAD-binding oxidoreductase [Streptococcus ovis]